MFKILSLFICFISCSVFANCEFAYLLNTVPRQFLSENSSTVVGNFKVLKNETTDGFYFYDGFSRVLETGEEVGRVLYQYNPERNSLFISHITVKLKKEKIGSALLAKVLAKYPHVTRVRTNLGLDNFKAYSEAKSLGKTDLEALKETAAYKMRKKLGFPHINKKSIDVEMEDESVIFEVTRFSTNE